MTSAFPSFHSLSGVYFSQIYLGLFSVLCWSTFLRIFHLIITIVEFLSGCSQRNFLVQLQQGFPHEFIAIAPHFLMAFTRSSNAGVEKRSTTNLKKQRASLCLSLAIAKSSPAINIRSGFICSKGCSFDLNSSLDSYSVFFRHHIDFTCNSDHTHGLTKYAVTVRSVLIISSKSLWRAVLQNFFFSVAIPFDSPQLHSFCFKFASPTNSCGCSCIACLSCLASSHQVPSLWVYHL